MILRPYQEQALDEIRKHYAAGRKRVLLHLATGGGKTLIFSTVLKGVVAKGKRGVLVVRGRELVDQASQRLMREGVPHGVAMAGHWNINESAPVQVCSIDTLFSRKLVPPADLIVIDEAHFASSKSFQWVVDQYPEAFFLPVTATPHVKKGLRHIADQVVYPITIGELMEQGYLTRPRYFAPSRVNLKDVGVDRGDYRNIELGFIMKDTGLYGDMVAAYRRHADGRSALCFAVDCEHSRELAQMFTAEGIAAEHVEAETSTRDRAAALRRLETGETKIICNVGILCVGVDIPHLGAVIMARPTKSYNLFIQQVGRGTRVYQGKSDFIVLDHANNLAEHGFIENEKIANLDGKTTGGSFVKPTICGLCFFVFEGFLACPLCGHVNFVPTREEGDRKVTLNKFVEMREIIVSHEMDFVASSSRERAVYKLMEKALAKGYKAGWVYHQLKSRYGDEYAKQVYGDVRKNLADSGA